jgi:hypothetical protein
MVQHTFHSDALLPLIGKMGKNVEPGLGPLPVRSRSVGTSLFQKFSGIHGMVIRTVNEKIRFSNASALFFRKMKGGTMYIGKVQSHETSWSSSILSSSAESLSYTGNGQLSSTFLRWPAERILSFMVGPEHRSPWSNNFDISRPVRILRRLH